MAHKLGSEIKVGDMVYIGIGHKTGRVVSFHDHIMFACLCPGYTARIAVTERSYITICDQQLIRVPE